MLELAVLGVGVEYAYPFLVGPPRCSKEDSARFLRPLNVSRTIILPVEYMVGLRIGAGGWDYFQVPGQDSLKAYSSVFDFVEVNSTYYEYPNMKAVSSWRSRVPESFEFSVRCHRDLVQALEPNRGINALKVLERMEKVCSTLHASLLAILVPAKIGLNEEELASGLEEVLSTFHADDTKIAVELRGGLSKKVLRVLEDNDAVHCVDLSTQQPAYESNIVYSRLFGKGQHNVYEFDDKELREIATKASAPKLEKSILAFHGVRMYRDAGRLKSFLQKGKFPHITGQTGLDSLKEVLEEDASFTATKSEIVSSQGWKLFDLTEDERIRAGEVLGQLQDRTYTSLDDTIASLKAQFPPEGLVGKTIHAKTQHNS